MEGVRLLHAGMEGARWRLAEMELARQLTVGMEELSGFGPGLSQEAPDWSQMVIRTRLQDPEICGSPAAPG